LLLDRDVSLAMNVAFTQAAEGLPRREFTVEDIRRMTEAGIFAEDENFELVEGELVVMAAKGIAHERVKSTLIVAFARALPDGLRLGAETSLRLTAKTLLEPDIAIFPKRVFENPVSGFANLEPADALLIVEVAHSSMDYDKGLKARLYARHRVREFWVIDAAELVTWVHTNPAEEGWGSIVERGPDETLTTAALPGFAIRLSAID
jgi:Uma2 family endonuclease